MPLTRLDKDSLVLTDGMLFDDVNVSVGILFDVLLFETLFETLIWCVGSTFVSVE